MAMRSSLPPVTSAAAAAPASASASASASSSLSSPLPGGLSSLAAQLEQAQDAYRRLQSNDDGTQHGRMQLSVHPGIPPWRVAVSNGDESPGSSAASAGAAAAAASASPSASVSAGLAYDSRRRELSSLTLELIMTLRMEQIVRLRDSFEAHGGVVSVAQFVAIMAAQLDVRRLHTTPDMLLRSLVELFEAMDLDGDGELEFEELLTTVVHMGLAATEHLLLTPISSYRDGPQFLVSMQQVERSVRFLPEREAILVIDQGQFACRLYDPSMKRALSVEFPLSSALAVEYVSGVQVDTQQHNASYRRGQNARASYYTSGAPSAKDERAKARKALEAANALHHKATTPLMHHSMWDKIASMPLSKPLRMENGQPMLHAHHAQTTSAAKGGHSDQQSRADPHAPTQSHSKPPSATLISQYAAQPYYSSASVSSLHPLTNAPQSSSSSSSSSSSRSSGSGSGSTPSSSSAYDRQSLVFLQEDWLVTSTSQHLQLWDGLPTGPVSLCDQKKIRNSYATIKWCPVLQKLFCGDVLGGIDVWRIVLLPTAPNAPVGHQNKPTLVKERELSGHTDIITGLESISSMGFLLSCSLDASVRIAGVVAIAYSNEYRFLLSAGSDHQVCVWSPFAEKQVYTLRGHHAPLIGVQFVPGTPQIVTADSTGCIKIWDARNFACCQSFQSMSQISSFTACSQRHKRIFVVGKCHEMSIYEQEGGPFLRRKQEEPIFAAVYSPWTMTICTANREDVKVWDGLTGNLSRVYRGLAESDLTAVCLDSRQRKLFVGDQQGKIRVYNYVTGAYMKSVTSHTEEIISMCYSGSRRLLISATDRTVLVHDERPIEEAVLYMTVTSGEGAEYLVVNVSEKLSSLACAMSNGKIDLWNLDQAMRDVPISGGHPDVITALYFLDAHQLLLSADDSGNIMAWFVRPSRWKGQLAFQLHTPAGKPATPSTALTLPTHTNTTTTTPKHAANAKQNAASTDPIRLVNAISTVPGISCMSFHGPSHQLFCGHRNGHIHVWNLQPLLHFIERVAADPTASWFVNNAQTHVGAAHESGHSLASSPSSSPAASSRRSSALPPLPNPLLLSPSRRSGVTFSDASPSPSSSNGAGGVGVGSGVPIKDQLSSLAHGCRPTRTIVAHDSVTTLHVCLDPPALLSTGSDHVARIWSLDGEAIGALDPVQGLARGYAMSGGGAGAGTAAAQAAERRDPEWRFHVDVATRAAHDRATTHQVLKSLESMALEAQARQQAAASAPSSRSTARSGRLPPVRSPTARVKSLDQQT